MEQAKTTNPDFEADFSLNGTSIAQPVRLLGARNQVICRVLKAEQALPTNRP